MEPCYNFIGAKSVAKWQIFVHILKFSKSEATEGLHFGLHFLYFLKIRLGTLSTLSGIKNQIDSIKTHLFIQK